jgi:hypothetical protein
MCCVRHVSRRLVLLIMCTSPNVDFEDPLIDIKVGMVYAVVCLVVRIHNAYVYISRRLEEWKWVHKLSTKKLIQVQRRKLFRVTLNCPCQVDARVDVDEQQWAHVQHLLIRAKIGGCREYLQKLWINADVRELCSHHRASSRSRLASFKPQICDVGRG